jgi:hypothetical protein
MTWKTKFGLAMVVLIFAFVGALYLSGFSTLMLSGVDAELSWQT